MKWVYDVRLVKFKSGIENVLVKIRVICCIYVKAKTENELDGDVSNTAIEACPQKKRIRCFSTNRQRFRPSFAGGVRHFAILRQHRSSTKTVCYQTSKRRAYHVTLLCFIIFLSDRRKEVGY